MKVRELVEHLLRCDQDAEVLFHEKMKIDEDEILDYGFRIANHIQTGFSMLDTEGDNLIYSAPGSLQGCPVDKPVVAISSEKLAEVKTNSDNGVTAWSSWTP